MDKTTLQVLRDAADKKIVCVGDVMLDVFVRGRVDRVSPEAPVPVLSEAESTYMPGGAANVAANAAAMGAVVDVIGVIGPDESGTKLRSLLDAQSGIHVDLVVDPDRATTCKTRFAASGQQMLRLDDERCDGLSRNLEDAVLFKVDAALKGASVLVLSDYAKGVLTDRLLSELRDLACGASAT
ncbi:MAG: PfkB family carbohydrate kinase [Pseudomonadota bacterium]